MVDVFHRTLAGEELHEPFHAVSPTDPGPIGAGKYWRDTSVVPNPVRARNAANTGWVEVAGTDPERVDDRVAALLVAGGGINLTYDDPGNQLTISAAANPEFDRSRHYLSDHFLRGGDNTNPFNIGELGWGFAAASSANATVQASEAGRPGILRLNSAAIAGSTSHLFLRSAWDSLLPSELFDARFLVRPSLGLTSRISWVGLGVGGAPSPGVNPPNFVGFEHRAGNGDTQWFARTNAGAYGAVTAGTDATRTKVATGATVADAAWYLLRVRRIDAAAIGFSVNGGAETTITTTVPTVPLSPCVTQYSEAAVLRALDIDWFAMKLSGLAATP